MLKYLFKKQSLIWALLLVVPQIVKATEDDLYDFLWLDPDKTVYVLQNKTYKKAKTFYADLGYIAGISNEYQDTTGIHFSTGYFFNEEWALELIYNKYSNSNNSAFTNLQTINQSVPFLRKQNSLMGAMAIWSPFYGKINTFNKIIYFDWSFGLGVAKVETESNAETVANISNADTYLKESYVGGLGKTGLRIHITPHVHLQLDYLRTMYQAPGPKLSNQPQTEKWRANSDLMFSIGLSF